MVRCDPIARRDLGQSKLQRRARWLTLRLRVSSGRRWPTTRCACSVDWIGVTTLAVVVGGLPLLAHLFGAQASWPFPRLFGALVLAVAGVTLYTTGTSFSYIVKLFSSAPHPAGAFRTRGNGRKIERHYWWLGLLAVVSGAGVYVAAAIFDLTNPAIGASWFAPVTSALLVLTGVQLVSAWGLARVLAELNERDGLAERDLNGAAALLDTSINRAARR